MTGREVDVGGKAVWVAEDGAGAPVLYLHGFVDIHAATFGWMPFHQKLCETFAVTAPAHPGCAGSDDDEQMETIDDVVFHYVSLLDVLGLDRFHLMGSCVGGWIAAELAVRYPERVETLTLLGATGLHVPGQPIGDLFWYAQPDDGVAYNGLRNLLFASADSALGRDLFPDGRAGVDQELLRFKMFRFANTIGFKPPYLYNPKLRGRLGRVRCPALVVYGREDRLVPRAHAEAYAEGLSDARLEFVDAAGHSVAAERPDETAALVGGFLSD